MTEYDKKLIIQEVRDNFPNLEDKEQDIIITSRLKQFN